MGGVGNYRASAAGARPGPTHGELLTVNQFGTRTAAHRTGRLIRRILRPAVEAPQQSFHAHELDFDPRNPGEQGRPQRVGIDVDVLAELHFETLEDDVGGHLRP